MTAEEANDLAHQIDDDGKGLTDWEIEFIDSIMKQTEAGRAPSPKQVDILNRIKRERC